MANASQNLMMNGLGTLNFSVPQTDIYILKGQISCPQLSEGSSSPSQVLLTINQNGSPVYTGIAGAEGFSLRDLSCSLGDTLAFIFSSSAPVDAQLNVIKSNIQIYSGLR